MRNSDVVRKIFALFEEGKTEEALALYHSDVIVEAWGSVLGGRYVGHEGLLQLASRVSTHLPGRPTFSVVNVADADDAVFVEFEGRTNLPTGEEVEWRTAEVFEIRDGRVAQVRLYTDTEALATYAAEQGPKK